MAITKIQSESLNLEDNYDFTGTVTGAGGVNTPAFGAERSGAQSLSNETRTTILFNNEFYDSNNAYDTSTGRFTPQVAGKYFVNSSCILQSGSADNFYIGFIELYKNGSVITEAVFDDRNGTGHRAKHAHLSAVVSMNGSTDYLLIQAYLSAAITASGLEVSDMATFSAFKIIE